MKIRILRGAHEIGGSCVEIEVLGSRLILDVGKPLWADWSETVPLPAVSGLADGSDPSLAGVVISHPHLDHYGLVDQVDPQVPLYIGREAAALLKAASFFSAAGIELHPTGYLQDRVPQRIGAFTVTPFLADHSAFDAYSILVEGGGRRVFYTGDIRGHGRKAGLFEKLLSDPPTPVDVLLCEGTHIRRAEEPDPPARSEGDVEASLVQRIRGCHGALLVISSAQNLDRLVTVYRAAKRTGRTLVTDLYTASLVQAIGRDTIPQPGFPDFKVYVPNRQRILVRRSEEFDRIDSIRECRVFPEWLTQKASDVVLLLPSSTAPELVRSGVLARGMAVWSLWPGYLSEPSAERLTNALREAGVPLVMDHASGHAGVADLQRLVTALSPTRLVPIHTEAGDRYGDYFEHGEPHPDGEWWGV